MWGVTVLQASVGSPQSSVVSHWTQVSFWPSPEASQTGVTPLHAVAFVAVHWTQASVRTLHAGVVPVQFASERHPTHVFVSVLHVGVAPEHCVLFTQATHVLVVVLQTGVDPEHCALLTQATHDAAVPPSPLQTPPVHGVPEAAFPHVPVAQVLHSPAHATLQHTLPTHSLLVH